VDCGATLEGWTGDAATSFCVGYTSPADAQLLEHTRAALNAGIAAAQPGARLGDISAAIGNIARTAGLGLHTDFGGHGIGRAMHESAPHVPNDGRAGRGMRLRPGLTIAIEPWFLAGGLDDYRFDDDGWTLRSTDGSRGAHFEHTIAVTTSGPRVLTTNSPAVTLETLAEDG
jgi:methionyl aminopeptidase